MINFADLELRVNKKYSFVGIRSKDSKLIFHLPKGFDTNLSSLNTFDNKRDLFFIFYRVLNVFKQTCLEKDRFDQGNKSNDRDGVVKDDSGTEITNVNDKEIIFYSKIEFIEKILDAYDELRILALLNRLGNSVNLDYSKLYRFLDKVVFLENGAIYLDYMTLPRKEVRFESSDIVSMYCYVLTEIKQQLKAEVRSEINALAERFREKYIGAEYSLFSEKYYKQVIDCLKDALEIIDKHTPFKDQDYWHFYDALAAFLFGNLHHSQKGKVWGINNFHSVWEAMCLTYLLKTTNSSNLLYLDTLLLSNKYLNYFNSKNKLIDLSEIFTVNNSQVFPDAVIVSCLELDFSYSQTPIYYQLKKDNWNDWNYLTSFYYPLFSRHVKIAYANQALKTHTFDELTKASGTLCDRFQQPFNYL